MVLAVEIVDRCSPKPFLGGWRDVARDLEFHDAVSQTPACTSTEYLLSEQPGVRHRQRVSVPVQTSARCTRAVETVGGVNRAIQADSCFPELEDRVVSVREAKIATRRRDAAVKIQRWYRAHRIRRRSSGIVDNNPKEKTASLDAEEQTVEDISEEENRSIPELPCISARNDIAEFRLMTSMDPRARDDADLRLLRTLLERWAETEEERIRAAVPAARMAAERAEKLRREIEFLRAIESTRNELAKKKAERLRAKFLSELSKPVDIQVTLKEEKRSTVQIETLVVQKAREFRDLYDNLEESAEDEQQHRIELLYALKRMAMYHTCPASLNLENLIDQELFLLSSKVEPSKLRALRSRIRLSFLRLAKGVLIRGKDRVKHESKTRLCQACGRLKRLEAFEVDHRQVMSKTCSDCAALRHKGSELQAHADTFTGMLRELRRCEAARPNGSCSLAFAIGPKTIGYLVNDIWHGRSAISECNDLERLRLVRLYPDEAWTPWNTLVATRREARMHEALSRESLPEAYGAELLRKFRRMNLQARLYFQRMAKNEDSGICL